MATSARSANLARAIMVSVSVCEFLYTGVGKNCLVLQYFGESDKG